MAHDVGPARCGDCGVALPEVGDTAGLVGCCAECAGWRYHLEGLSLMARSIDPRRETDAP